MKSLSRLLLIPFALGNISMSHALSSKQVSQEPIVATKIKTEVKELTTPGGLKLWFVFTPDIPVVTLKLNFKNAGSINDPKGLIGLTDFLSAMMDEGAGEYDSVDFKKLIREKNIQFNAGSGKEHFSFQFRSTRDGVGDLFQILNLVLYKLRFDQSALEHMRQDIYANLQQSLHSENVKAGEGFKRQAFGDHPLGYTTEMHLKDLPNISKQSMIDYMKTNFTKENLQITVAGDIDEKDLMKILDETLGDLSDTAPMFDLKSVDVNAPGGIKVIEMDIPQSVIIFYQPGISREDPDFYKIFVMMKIISDNAFESRLWNEIREKRGLVYGVGADLRWSPQADYVIGHAATANKNVKEVIQLIQDEWTKMRDKGATADELAFVKQHLVGAYPLGFTSTPQIVALLDNYQSDKLPSDFISKRNDYIQKVTLDDVNRVAKSFLDPSKLSFIVVGKPEGLSVTDSAKE